MTIVAGAMLFALGCTENPDEVSRKQGDVLSDPSAIIVRMNQMTNEIFELRERKGFLDDRIISKSIAAVTNDAARLQLVDRLSACVLALDVSRLSYKHQYNALLSIEDVMKMLSLAIFRVSIRWGWTPSMNLNSITDYA